MTREDFVLFTQIIGDNKPLDKAALCQEVVDQWRRAEHMREQMVWHRAEAQRIKRQKNRKPSDRQVAGRIARLEADLAAKESALSFAVRRNEVLRSQLAAALNGHASSPARALAAKNGGTS